MKKNEGRYEIRFNFSDKKIFRCPFCAEKIEVGNLKKTNCPHVYEVCDGLVFSGKGKPFYAVAFERFGAMFA